MILDSGADGELALAFVSTIRHDGDGGVADDLETDEQLAAWIAERWPRARVDATRVRELRRAARAAFAATVSPAPPSRADAANLMTASKAGGLLTEAIAGLQLSSEVDLTSGSLEVRRTTTSRGDALVLGCLALAVTDFLTGPLGRRLRSCQAPRCVRYFVQSHGKQQWCKQSCGNRARVARHAARHR
ncbi:ABATE domain-containing protein [Kribbella sp. NPDC002412]